MTKIIPFPPAVRPPTVLPKSVFAGYPRFAREFGHPALKLVPPAWHPGPANDHDAAVE
jgi:hypothetical protein